MSSVTCCKGCKNSLAGQKYIVIDEKPYCNPCYEKDFAKTCADCNKLIGADSKSLKYNDRHFHDTCFICGLCKKPLAGELFNSKDNAVYCGDCYDENFAGRCSKCNEPFRAGTKKSEYKGQLWHEDCFKCSECNKSIGSVKFTHHNDAIVCMECYNDKYAKRCSKCNEIIKDVATTFDDKTYHKECFTCCKCNKMLAGEKFTLSDGKPACTSCS